MRCLTGAKLNNQKTIDMDRRGFLKSSATAAIAGAAMTIPGAEVLASAKGEAVPDKTPEDGIAYRLKYNKDGKIKILQRHR